MTQIKNIEDLRDAVLDTFDLFKKKEITASELGAVCGMSQTVIAGVKTEIDYWKLSKQTPVIPFLESPSTKKMINQPNENNLLTHSEESK